MRQLRIIALACLPLLALTVLAAPEPTLDRAWTFDVYLDDSKIGFHEYRLESQEDGKLRLEAEAKFDVRILFINAFRYRHEIEETWSGDCLTGVVARTNSNGKRTEVQGELTDDGFTVRKDDSSKALEDCVMTFAYWNPAFLEQPRLLNPQTGEFVEVNVERLGDAELVLGKDKVIADEYRITAKDMEVRVWYSQESTRWLALESATKGGRKIRYELRT